LEFPALQAVNNAADASARTDTVVRVVFVKGLLPVVFSSRSNDYSEGRRADTLSANFSIRCSTVCGTHFKNELVSLLNRLLVSLTFPQKSFNENLRFINFRRGRNLVAGYSFQLEMRCRSVKTADYHNIAFRGGIVDLSL
jgi:hypothetical protein